MPRPLDARLIIDKLDPSTVTEPAALRLSVGLSATSSNVQISKFVRVTVHTFIFGYSASDRKGVQSHQENFCCAPPDTAPQEFPNGLPSTIL